MEEEKFQYEVKPSASRQTLQVFKYLMFHVNRAPQLAENQKHKCKCKLREEGPASFCLLLLLSSWCQCTLVPTCLITLKLLLWLSPQLNKDFGVLARCLAQHSCLLNIHRNSPSKHSPSVTFVISPPCLQENICNSWHVMVPASLHSMRQPPYSASQKTSY